MHELCKGEVIDGIYKGSKFIYSSDYVTISAQLLGCYEKEVQQKIFELSKKTPVIPELKHLHSINFERGMLLYGLIAKLKPKTVLEIGTAGG